MTWPPDRPMTRREVEMADATPIAFEFETGRVTGYTIELGSTEYIVTFDGDEWETVAARETDD